MNLYQVVVGQQSVRTLFKSLAQLFFVNMFEKMAAGSHFGCPKITSYHFRSIPQFLYFCDFFTFTKWLPATILDVRNSPSMAFLAISDQYETLFVFEMFDIVAAVGHLDVRNLLSISFLAISDQYATLCFGNFFVVGHFGCPKFTFDRISGHFRSIQNLFFYKMAAGAHFGCPKFTFYL